MDYLFMLAQAVGFVGLGYITYAFQKEKKTDILRIQSVGSLLFAIHFALLGAHIGALLSATVVVRNQLFSRKHTHAWANNIIWPLLICGFSLFWLLTAWEGLISLLPVFGMLVATYAMWLDDTQRLKKYIILSSALWIPYSIFHHAIPSLINQIFVCVSAFVATRKQQKKILQTE